VNCLEGKAHPYTGDGTPEYHLIQAAVAGNRAAYDVLIQKHKAHLIDSLRQTIANDALLDDALSHALASAYENLHQFRGEASFFTWVYRIALNHYTSSYRKPTGISLDQLDSGDENVVLADALTSEPCDQLLVDRERNHQAMKVLDSVPPLYRQVLDLYFLQNLTYEGIARRLRIPEGTVMSRLHKARKLLHGAWRRQTALSKN
jgi:RNA polymerase sigma-70 factor (ECF subfamily)